MKQRFLHRVVTFMLAALILITAVAACMPVPPEIQTRMTEAAWTLTPSVTVEPSVTIQWFPPTPTRTPVPVNRVEPTPDQRPGIGTPVFFDDFAMEEGWQTVSNNLGTVGYDSGRLTIAIRQSKASLLSLLSEPSLVENAYVEITASPSLCRGNDAYGLLLRAAGPLDFYRFAINCSGNIRLERVKNGEISLVQDWQPSGQVPPGSPLVLRIGVWTRGREMRFFLNDIYQFSATDPVFDAGMLGVYAKSAGDTALTVSFSDLVVYNLDE